MPNLYEDHAREILGIGPEYKMAGWDGTNEKLMKVRFKIAPVLASGEIAWKYAEPKSQKVATFSPEAHREWVKAWEIRTGRCSNCSTEKPGHEWTGWSAKNGSDYQICRRCNGTGKSTLHAAGEGEG